MQRADCYAADIIMRQYVKAKADLGDKFTFKHLHMVYCIILMEKSPQVFKTIPGKYLHRRTASFDTGILTENPGLHEDIFICLDVFHEIVHNITERSTLLEAWLTFLSATDIETVEKLTKAFPKFLSLYQEITDFVKNPTELMNMLSEELYIMDRNMERLMVEELQEKANALQGEKTTWQSEKAALQSENTTLQIENAAFQKELEEKDAIISKLLADQGNNDFEDK